MRLLHKFYSLALSSVLATGVGAQQPAPNECSSEGLSFPSLLGAELIAVTAQSVSNYSAPSLNPANPGPLVDVSFCNVTVTYTHLGWNDTIHVSVWLPSPESWTGYIQAMGGGGYSASPGPQEVPPVIAAGNVAAFTDAGHSTGLDALLSPSTWALVSPGNVNLYLLEDFAARSLHELAVVAKAITQDFYASELQYSFFTGCSMGGRQAMTIAQRYPTDFDGILAISPSINYEKFAVALYWAQQTMNNLSTFPPNCETDGFTSAAIDECDGLDGVEDRIISLPGLCNFTASSVVGQEFDCNGTQSVFSAEGAQIVQAAWDGPQGPSPKTSFPGLNKDASLTSLHIYTECSSNGTCAAVPSVLLTDWIIYLLAKDPDFDIANMTTDEYFMYMAQSVDEYAGIMGAADPDLSAFRAAGGKLITWHGLADPILVPNNTVSYYRQVLELDPAADEFYRFFQAPGVSHCSGGLGAMPVMAFEQLVGWVENGTAPETLVAMDANGTVRDLCPYPKEQVYVGGNVTDRSSFECA